MDSTAAGATSRGVSLPMSSSRKEWRAVSDHHQPRNPADENLERQTNERTIYEVHQGREAIGVDFCSITIDGSSGPDILQQRLHSIATQREELQQVEIELRAQIIAKSEIMEMQNSFDAQMKEHTNAASRLQEQFHEREQAIHELERRMNEKDRELHAIKLDNEAAWAKEDLLREQNKELAAFRRERDHSEVERTQHIKQLHELQEHIEEKERQLMELQEQHRVAQETIIFKDDQLRDAQTWIARVQEMDGLQSNSLQAELRDRVEHYNQILLAWQRQFAEIERHHVHTIQQLQLELADERERTGTYNEESRIARTNSKEASLFGQNNGHQLDVNGGVTSSGTSGVLLNGNSEHVPSYASNGNQLTQAELVDGMPLATSPLLGVHAYLPPGQVPAMHPFVIHQQGVPHSVPSHVPQSHVAHLQSVPPIASHQQWQSQQTVPECSHPSAQNQILPVQTNQNMLRSDANHDYDNGQAIDVHFSPGMNPDSVIPSSSGESQVLESIKESYYPVAPQSEQSLQQMTSQFHDALRLNFREPISETKEQKSSVIANHELEEHGLIIEQPNAAANTSLPNSASYSVNHGETTAKKTSVVTFPESHVSTGQTNSLTEITLLDERSLLSCVVRTIPAGGRIRISSTLPNRLGKMLAPLHWHDYKKRHGKLEDFVASHPELFVIEDDYIQLREGAQGMITAKAAVAKVAAAAAASTPHSVLPSVAVTPMAQSHRLKDSKHGNTDSSTQLSELHSRHMNVTNGGNLDRSGLSSTRGRGSTNGQSTSNYAGKQLSRTSGATSTTRR